MYACDADEVRSESRDKSEQLMATIDTSAYFD